MGKVKKVKARYSDKFNPVGTVTNLPENIKYDDLNPIAAIRDQLQSQSVDEKLNGLQSLAYLASNKDKVKDIISSDIVRIVAPLLCDHDKAVRNATAGALRNLSIYEVEICEYLVERDVLTPLLTLLREYADNVEWTPIFDATLRGQVDLYSDIFLHAINVLWNLCESSDIALDTLNQTQFVQGLVRCIDFKLFGMDIAISVAQCLLVISENNPKLWNCVNQHVSNFLNLLNISGSHEHTYLRTLAAGVLSNVPALSAAYAHLIFLSLAETLDVDHKNHLINLIQCKINQEQDESSSKNYMDVVEDGPEEALILEKRNETDIVIKDLGYLLNAQRLACEIITNICCGDEDDVTVECNAEDASESEDMVDLGIMKNGSSLYNRNIGTLPIEITEVVRSLELIKKIWQKAHPISNDILHMLREHNPTLLTKIKNLQISALFCLQNLCNVLSVEDLGGSMVIYGVWIDLGVQFFKGPQDNLILEAATSLMRSSLEHLKMNKELFSKMEQNDLELVLNGIKMCTVAEIRANWLRMLGTLGCLLSESLVKTIIEFIMDTCTKEDDIWTISEALDALMDIFADNDWNEIIRDLNLPQRVKNLETMFKNKVKIKQQKRQIGERYSVMQTVQFNFTRFVKYIENESTK